MRLRSHSATALAVLLLNCVRSTPGSVVEAASLVEPWRGQPSITASVEIPAPVVGASVLVLVLDVLPPGRVRRMSSGAACPAAPTVVTSAIARVMASGRPGTEPRVGRQKGNGLLIVDSIPAGTHDLEVLAIGLERASATVTLRAGQTDTLVARLSHPRTCLEPVVWAGRADAAR